jgi:hypothetical protein
MLTSGIAKQMSIFSQNIFQVPANKMYNIKKQKKLEIFFTMQIITH